MKADVERGPGGGVLAVHLRAGGQRLTLIGYCRYWVGHLEAGAFNCPEHEDEFGPPIAYRWHGRCFLRVKREPPEDDVLEGEWVSDDEWKARRW